MHEFRVFINIDRGERARAGGEEELSRSQFSEIVDETRKICAVHENVYE